MTWQDKGKGKQVATDGTPMRRPRKIARQHISPDPNKCKKKVGHTLPKVTVIHSNYFMANNWYEIFNGSCVCVWHE